MTSFEHLPTVCTDYDAMAQAYAAFIGDAFTGSPLNQVLVQAFAALIQQAGGGTVADVGCRPGHVGRRATAALAAPPLTQDGGAMGDLRLS